MSDYTPTTEEVVEALKYGAYHRVGYGTVRMGREELFRWLGREREAAALNARIEERDFFRSQMPAHDAEVRAAVLTEQGEPEWEYGTALLTPAGKIWDEEQERSRADAEDHVRECMAGCIVVKRALVPWLPVEDPS